MLKLAFAGCCIAVIAAAAPCRAADQWLEVKSAHFTVVSNVGQGEARSELGKHDGLGYVRRAISLAPQESNHHLSAARVLSRERNFDEARKEVQAAQATARTGAELQRVRELAQWLETARGRG